MTVFTTEQLEPRIERLARRKFLTIVASLPPDDAIYLAVLKRACRPWAMAALARRLWVRGHDIEGMPCPRIGYRLTSGPLVG